MKNEIEAKFVDVNVADIRTKLRTLGAQLIHPMRSMKRVTIETTEMKQKNSFLRVRDGGDRTTLTYKQFDALSLDGVKEIEVEISSFDATVALLAAAGLPHSSLQESRRETWTLDEVEIVIDEWPWLNPYIEIEGPSKEAVMTTARGLDLDWSEAVFGDVMAAYRAQYPHISIADTIGHIANVRFNDPLPDFLKQ